MDAAPTVAGTLDSALTAALADLTMDDRDGAVVALAHAYAQAIDAGTLDLPRLGSVLLSALESLMLTPRARAVIMRGGTPSAEPNSNSPLDELRKRRASRQRRTPHMDATAS